MGLFTKVFGTYSQRELKSIYPIVDKITALEDAYKALTDDQVGISQSEFKIKILTDKDKQLLTVSDKGSCYVYRQPEPGKSACTGHENR